MRGETESTFTGQEWIFLIVMLGDKEYGTKNLNYNSRKGARISDRQLPISHHNAFMTQLVYSRQHACAYTSAGYLDIMKYTKGFHETACDMHEHRGQSEDDDYN